MFTHIKTSKENKEIVSKLTRKLNLGAENIISRIAFAYSLSKGTKLDLADIKNSQGKEYSNSVLFGEYLPYYISMVCVNYKIYKNDKDIPKYIKMHIDDGLEMINQELADNPNLDGFEYVIDKIENGLLEIC